MGYLVILSLLTKSQNSKKNINFLNFWTFYKIYSYIESQVTRVYTNSHHNAKIFNSLII